MKFYANMKIRTKLVSGFAIVLLLALAIGVVGLYSIIQLTAIAGEIDNNRVPAQADLLSAVDNFQLTRAYIKDMLLLSDPAAMASYGQKLNEASDASVADMNSFGSRILPQDTALQAQYDNFQKAHENYKTLRQQLYTLSSSGETNQQAIDLMYSDGAAATVTGVLSAIDGLENELQNTITESGIKLNDIQRNALVMVISVLVAAIIIGLLLGLAISTDISKSVAEILSSVKAVADGNFTISLDIHNESDMGILADAVNQMIDRLRDMLNRVNQTAFIVDDASKQVSSSSMSLAQISTEQASSVEQISASMTEITSQTKANAENAGKATQLSDATRDKAVRGNGLMGEMLSAMKAINDTSSSISNIIKVIDDIAFQTNILALNAAVEAARAGQHGKGFAVVAEEVRNLAARSAKAASETTQLIEGAIKEVSRGTQIANETAGSLNEIVEGVTQSATLVSEISEASVQQSQGASQISIGMEQVSQAIQTTSSVAEEAASSSSELSDQANKLKELVSAFKFEANGQSLPSSGRAAAYGGAKAVGGGGDGRRQNLGAGRAAQGARRPQAALGSGAPAPAQHHRAPNVPDIDMGRPNDFGKY